MLEEKMRVGTAHRWLRYEAGPSSTLAVALLSVCGAACGPSYRALHESHVQFERCYAMDEDPRVSMTAKALCWQSYERAFASQSADRQRYATDRARRLQAVAEAPTDESLMSAAPGSSDVHVTTPLPDSASAPMPVLLDGGNGTAPRAK
jgi:hypothetical protein